MVDKINVKGIAIRAGTSRNGITYTKEELVKFAETMKGRPILKDHRSETDNTIGKLTGGNTLDAGKTVNYEGWIKEDGTGLIEKIHDERVSEVSIGSHVQKIVENEEGEVFAIGMTCMEISTTPTPGVIGTSLTQALESKNKKLVIAESFDTKENIKEEDKMAEEPVAEEPKVEEPVAEEPKVEEPVKEEPAKEEPVEEEPAEVKKEETVTIKVDSSQIDEALDKMSKLTKAKESLKEKVKEVKDIKENTKAKVVKEEEKEDQPESKLTVEQCSYGEGVSLWKEPKDDGSLI